MDPADVARKVVAGAGRRWRAAVVPLALHARYELVNRSRRRPVVDPAGTCDVSLTTFGARLSTVHLTIETIAAGEVLPRSLTLWLSEEDAAGPFAASLRRLQARGLRVVATTDWGAHKKYYPHVASGPPEVPLVTADDDVFYPRDWLSGLLAAHTATPRAVVAHRAYRFGMDGDRPAPYSTWVRCTSTDAAPDVFATGVSGVLYPVEVLRALRAAGEAFTRVAPRADDVWLHATALRCGVPVRQTGPRTRLFPAVGGTQRTGLKHTNVVGGGNDDQIAATYSAHELAVLRAAGSR